MVQPFNRKKYSELAYLESRHWGKYTHNGQNILLGDKVFLQWANHPVIKVYNNIVQTGDPSKDWLNFLFDHFKQFHYGCSIGCGSGWVERILISKDLVGMMDCFDISEGAVNEANKTNEFPDRLHFSTQDCNKLNLEKNKYDLIFFHHSFHHLLELEHIIDTIEKALIDEGVVVLVDYVGETRGQWSARKIALCEYVLDLMPEGALKSVAHLDDDFFRENPFEMIRAAEILPLMNNKFHSIWQCNFGGILYPINNTIVSAIELRQWDKFIWLACLLDAVFEEHMNPCFTFSIFCKKKNIFDIVVEKPDKGKIIDFLLAYGLKYRGESVQITDSELMKMRYAMEAVKSENRRLKEHISEIYSTFGWSILNRIRFCRDKVLPSESRRGNAYKKIMEWVKERLFRNTDLFKARKGE